VINISSIMGVFAAPKATAYVASKFAVLGFSRSLRAELAPHRIGVTAICPGMIATAIVDDSRMSGAARRRAPQISDAFRRRGAHPDVVARAILDAVRTNPAVRPVGRDDRLMVPVNLELIEKTARSCPALPPARHVHPDP
jgi:NAD(P)-dependent dehydrogenase (short-subunit alcohol dehydrogenase family)